MTLIQKLKLRALIKRLHKLSVSAYSLDLDIQKSKLPDSIKETSKTLTDYYSTLLLKFNSREV